MCGIIGIIGHNTDAVTEIRSGLAFLQHRGQDSCGIAVMQDQKISIEKGYGLAEDALDINRLSGFTGRAGIGHVRYSTAGSASAASEGQPFYVNQPYGMTLAHNGNLTNRKTLRVWLNDKAQRHINSDSDSEVLLNILAHIIAEQVRERELSPDLLFDAVRELHRRCEGSYAVVALIAGVGLLAFRDPHGIRPLSVGGEDKKKWLVVSESVAFRPLDIGDWNDIAPGEAVFIDNQQHLHRRQCAPATKHCPCMFEYIYLARPDSSLDGVSVYRARLNMGRKLAEKISREYGHLSIDCVVPVPDSGRVAAMELAHTLEIPYREGLVKNRHSVRTFISAGQDKRQQSVRKKLNVITDEFAGKNVLLVDDSIVRGTTGRQLVALARAARAKKVYFASAAPPVRFPNVYGIDIPTRSELLAGNREKREIAAFLGVDDIIYQDLDDLIDSVREVNPKLGEFELSCFNGDYPVGNIDEQYLAELEKERRSDRDDAVAQRHLLLSP